ncbi:MAG: SDR family NAD(P)-dependent oxidoreductase [Deltaproteobacteria bacterium]|nr:SDR family NAD(P)-dependent oxidoreductase [Deltaproteobacteria bacterium]
MEKIEKSGIVTGAAQGIGKAIAWKLLQEGYGLSLLDILDHELAQTEKEFRDGFGDCTQSIHVDVTNPGQVKGAMKAHVERFGGIDLLVNNAGILIKGSCEETSDESWDQVLRVNLYGPFYLCRAVIPYMKAKPGGAIVNVSSRAGRSFTPFGGVPYASSKAGLLGLTRQLAHELAPFRIRVNAVCPSGTLTPLAKTLRTPEETEKAARSFPLGRFAEPEDVAAGVAFLASDEAAYITGVALDINGGTLMI